MIFVLNLLLTIDDDGWVPWDCNNNRSTAVELSTGTSKEERPNLAFKGDLFKVFLRLYPYLHFLENALELEEKQYKLCIKFPTTSWSVHVKFWDFLFKIGCFAHELITNCCFNFISDLQQKYWIPNCEARYP